MIRATSIIRRDAVDHDRIVDIITLDHGDRHRRRIVLNADGGTVFLLDLDKADVLEDGDAIRLDSGWLVEDRLTLADIAVASPFANFRHLRLDIDGGKRPKLAAYIDKMLGRESFRPWVEKETAFLEKTAV